MVFALQSSNCGCGVFAFDRSHIAKDKIHETLQAKISVDNLNCFQLQSNLC